MEVCEENPSCRHLRANPRLAKLEAKAASGPQREMQKLSKTIRRGANTGERKTLSSSLRRDAMALVSLPENKLSPLEKRGPLPYLFE